MSLLDLDHLLRYWTATQWQANVLMLLHLMGAMFLGLVLGYERAYHGRAAGMRTVAATYGYMGSQADSALWKADASISSPLELLKLLNSA